MRLCVDLQGAQTESRFRGIGRYTANFVRALVAARGAHTVRLVANGALADHAHALLAELGPLLGSDSVAFFDPLGRVAHQQPQNAGRARIAERLREAFLGNLAPDVVYASSVVEGWLDDAVTSIGEFDRSLPTAATFYDAIPLLRADDYLVDARYRAFYRRKVESLQRADLLLAISEYAREEAITALQLDSTRVVTIGCGIESCFVPDPHGNGVVAARRAYSQGRPYVLYAGGFDRRKNVARLVEAYGRLGAQLRKRHALVIGGRIGAVEQRELREAARLAGLDESEVFFTGTLPDAELIALYRGAELFVFPSLHEGFGLPVAEAMACGAPVIASSTTSVPEVIGRADALFDPLETAEITMRMERALTDAGFRDDLRSYGIERARSFTWEACAARAWAAFEMLHERRARTKILAHPVARPRLAFVSPLPPSRTGVADYSAGLIPALAEHYDIEAVCEEGAAELPASIPVRTIEWFDANARAFDRILYHVGNSPFHARTIDALKKHPGVVVMHDFYLTGFLGWLEEHGGDATGLRRELYAAHGYAALVDDAQAGRAAAQGRYPASLSVFRAAAGMIVHSRHVLDLATRWYGPHAAQDIEVIPHYAAGKPAVSRAAARAAAGIPADAFVVCSFGFLAPTKLNDRLLRGWQMSGLAQDPRAWLVFVGENEGGEYGREIERGIRQLGVGDRVRITGFVDDASFDRFLAAADVAVQLRSGSRGETSGAILKALCAGLPTVVNAHGAAAEYPDDVVCRLAENFDDSALAATLRMLRQDPNSRAPYGAAATAFVATHHALPAVAGRYRDGIERFAVGSGRAREARLVREIGSHARSEGVRDDDLMRTAQAIVAHRREIGARQILVDVTVVARSDLRTGIERVVRGVLNEWLRTPPAGYRVEPVRDDGSGRYVYARHYAQRVLGLPQVVRDEPVEVRQGDVFLGLDWYADGIPRLASLLADWRRRGVKLHFVVYDILPLTLPDAFPDTSKPMVEAWLDTMSRVGDGIACISRAVADDLYRWLETRRPDRAGALSLGFFALGSTLDDTLPTTGVPAEAAEALARLADRPVFLMVGTVEPRKAHAQVLDAFDHLWAHGIEAHLVIVGKQGWMMDAVAARLREHPESGLRLFWFEDASDELLEKLYACADALVAASRGEGFGLPIVEAARHGIPVIARDLPVFREVAGEHAAYFSGESAEALAQAVAQWLAQREAGGVPSSSGIVVHEWSRSAEELRALMLEDRWYRRWPAATT